MPRLPVFLGAERPIHERKPAMFNDESAATMPESVPSTEPTPPLDQEPVPEPEPLEQPVPEQPAEVAEESSQEQAT
jgi:hypothetical protein